jgi:hypothetical protein
MTTAPPPLWGLGAHVAALIVLSEHARLFAEPLGIASKFGIWDM